MSELDGHLSSEPIVPEFVHVIVGGQCFSLALSDLQRFPLSYFHGMMNKQWNPDPHKPVCIDRDGHLFRFIADYIFYGILPIGRVHLDYQTMQLIQSEADFYNLPELVDYCEEFALAQLRSLIPNLSSGEKQVFQADSNDGDDLLHCLSSIWSPFCLKGFADTPRHKLLLKNSTPFDLSIPELLSTSQLSCAKSTFNCFEIDAGKLIPDTVDSIRMRIGDFQLCARTQLKLVATKLITYTEGGYCSTTTNYHAQEGKVGTLVYILNSEYTGGDIVVGQKDTEVSISEPREWLAFHTGCSYEVKTVLSGTLVYIEFDIYDAGVLPLQQCWDARVGDMFTPPSGQELSVNAPRESRILSTVQKQLQLNSSVVVVLTTLYPILNSDLDVLQAGDATLCNILQSADYEVEIVIVSIQRRALKNVPSIVGVSIVDFNDITQGSDMVQRTLPETSIYDKHSVDNVDNTDNTDNTDNANNTVVEDSNNHCINSVPCIVIPIVATSNWVLLEHSKISVIVTQDVFLTTGLRIARKL